MTQTEGELLTAARAWRDADPDPATARELDLLIERRDLVELASRMEPLAFGTAGLRGEVGAGPGRMNDAVVLRTAYGLARYLAEQPGSAPRTIVVGFDARPTSQRFAELSAGVLLHAGFAVIAFTAPVATPLCAFLGREAGAALTIVVTASHNPRGDNGYKVYASNAVQIIAPVDREIAERIAHAPEARLVQKRPATFAAAAEGMTLRAPAELSAYFDAVSAALPAAVHARDLPIVHSALHGVGTAPMRHTLADAGFTRVRFVASQAEPDGSFPTTPFPNPEEPGTVDLALAEAERQAAAILLVNDPDADRLSAAARLDGVLTVLDGNQVGALLADARLSAFPNDDVPLVLSSVVSSPLVGLLGEARGAHHERTHTGFKWLWSAALELERRGRGRFCFAYEEALGYSVFPAVRDKDGIAAGRALAELSATLATRGATLFDRLFELYEQHGLWASSARNVALTGSGSAEHVARIFAGLTEPDSKLAPLAMTRIIDYRSGASEREPWLGPAPLLELQLADSSRVFVRPSGTEPKLKLYAHVKRSVTLRGDFARDLAEARRSAEALLEAIVEKLQP